MQIGSALTERRRVMAKVEIPVQVTIPVEDLVEYLKKDGTLVDVVRCKDCKFYEKGHGCDLLDVFMLNMDDWFCAAGEAKHE